MFNLTLILLLFVQSMVFAISINDVYQEGANLGKAMQTIVNNSLNNLDLKKEGIKNYQENPAQTKYYKGITSDNANDLVADGEKEYTYNEDDSKNNGVQAALKSFKKNSPAAYKIDANNSNDPIIKRAANIMTNAKDIVSGNNEKETCKDVLSCHIAYVKKTCNEQTRSLKRICERVPDGYRVTTEYHEYPHTCQRLDVNQGHWNTCGGGGRYEGSLLYTDMLGGPTWDDVYLCPRNNEQKECYVGYLVQGIGCINNRNLNPSYEQGRGKIPKGCQGYMKFLHTYHRSLSGRIVNETTNEEVEKGDFQDGRIVVLPMSKTQDQIFKFTPTNGGQVGVVIIYVDKVTATKVAGFASWKEGECRDL